MLLVQIGRNFMQQPPNTLLLPTYMSSNLERLWCTQKQIRLQATNGLDKAKPADQDGVASKSSQPDSPGTPLHDPKPSCSSSSAKESVPSSTRVDNKAQGSTASANGAIAASLQGLLVSMHTRVNSAQAQAQAALADMGQRAQSKLAVRKESDASRQGGQQQQSPQEQLPFATRVYSRLQGVSAAVNQLTGYTAVEHLKEAVARADEDLVRLREDMERKKQAHESMLETQLNLQRDLNSLLQKKSSWSDQDVLRFTELCRIEHKTDADVAAARDAHEEAADKVDAAQAHLFKAIRERYTEEQLWGDKIRRTATWWTWGLMGLQMLSFMGVILVVEPRRVRLLQGHMQTMLETHEARMQQHLDAQLEAQCAQGGGQHSRVGDERGEELAKVLSAVVTFMDGVNTELGIMRGQLVRLEAAGKPVPKPGAPVFASDFGYDAETADPRQAVQGIESVQGASHIQGGAVCSELQQQQQQQQQQERKTDEEADMGRQHLLGGERMPHANSWWRKKTEQWSPEQAAGVAAAVGSGVGAVVGALLVAYFSSR